MENALYKYLFIIIIIIITNKKNKFSTHIADKLLRSLKLISQFLR